MAMKESWGTETRELRIPRHDQVGVHRVEPRFHTELPPPELSLPEETGYEFWMWVAAEIELQVGSDVSAVTSADGTITGDCDGLRALGALDISFELVGPNDSVLTPLSIGKKKKRKNVNYYRTNIGVVRVFQRHSLARFDLQRSASKEIRLKHDRDKITSISVPNDAFCCVPPTLPDFIVRLRTEFGDEKVKRLACAPPTSCCEQALQQLSGIDSAWLCTLASSAKIEVDAGRASLLRTSMFLASPEAFACGQDLIGNIIKNADLGQVVSSGLSTLTYGWADTCCDQAVPEDELVGLAIDRLRKSQVVQYLEYYCSQSVGALMGGSWGATAALDCRELAVSCAAADLFTAFVLKQLEDLTAAARQHDKDYLRSLLKNGRELRKNRGKSPWQAACEEQSDAADETPSATASPTSEVYDPEHSDVADAVAPPYGHERTPPVAPKGSETDPHAAHRPRKK